MKVRLLTLACLLLSAAFASAQTDVRIGANSSVVRITFMSADIVRVQRVIDGEYGTFDGKSLSVVMSPRTVRVKSTESEKAVTLRSEKLSVTVDKGNGGVSFHDLKGNALLSESKCKMEGISEGLDKGCLKPSVTFALDSNEPIYGIGLMQNGKLNQRGENRRMIQTNLEDFQNVFQSLKGYAVFWDNYSPTQIADSPAEGLTLTSDVGDAVDYYFMYGGSLDGNVGLIRQLTGDVPMLPIWSYGYWQSRERYKSSKELLGVVDRYRELGIPFDGIILDWQYWGSNYLWNAMEFLNPEFPNAKGMIDEVHSKNAHFAISIWQSFGPHTKGYKQMDEKGLLFDFQTWPASGVDAWPPRNDYPSGVKAYKPYSDEAKDIYWNNMRRLYDLGVDVWWMDSTDPDHLSVKESDFDVPTALGSYRKVRNAFPLECVKGVYEHQRATTSDKRVMILTRSGFAGQQRFASNVWTGDVGSNWATLRKQIPMTLNFSLTGNPHVNTDIGGFFSGAYNWGGDPVSGTQNLQFRELYVRWMQFGVFAPMMRSHGTDTYRELYYYGEPGEPVYDALKEAVELRYRLIPYIYSTAWQVTKNRQTFMRALPMDFAADTLTHNMTDEFMFGKAILAAPIVSAMYTDEKIVKAGNRMTTDFTYRQPVRKYLPKGTDWYEFLTGKRHEGGKEVEIESDIHTIPMFVRAGSILPLSDVKPSINERDWSTLEVVVYPGADASFTLYEDEGDNYNYEQGKYTEIPMRWDERSQTLTIGKRTGAYEGMIQKRLFKVRLAGKDAVREVEYSGGSVKCKL